jgi:hypothetical protein
VSSNGLHAFLIIVKFSIKPPPSPPAAGRGSLRLRALPLGPLSPTRERVGVRGITAVYATFVMSIFFGGFKRALYNLKITG